MTTRRRGAPVIPEMQQATAARQGFGGGQGGRVRNASPVRGKPRGRRQSGGAVDPCGCCRCQRITSATLEYDAEVGDGPYDLLNALNCACAYDELAGGVETRPWVFIDGQLWLNAWWDPGEPDENGDYYCTLKVDGLPGTGPWTWAWLWESSTGCWQTPT